MEIVYVYQRKRKEFGKQTHFRDRPAVDLTTNLPPDPSYSRNYVERNTGSVEVQCVPEKSEHEVNTESFLFSNRGILHTQGGWPKDVDCTDIEHTIRYKKKIEKDEEYMRAVKSLGDVREKSKLPSRRNQFQQNICSRSIVINFRPWSIASSRITPLISTRSILWTVPNLSKLNRHRLKHSMSTGMSPGAYLNFSVQLLHRSHNLPHKVFMAICDSKEKQGADKDILLTRFSSDPNTIKRAASSVSWYPDSGHKIAIAYSVLQFQQMPESMSMDSYIWDVENPSTPDQTITPSSPLVCLKYNPKDPHILVGGSYNGLVCM